MRSDSQIAVSLRSATRSLRAFTLVEILAVVAVSAILLTFPAQILGGGFSMWSNVHGSLDTEAEARSALDRMTRDLQSYVEPPAGGESFHLVRNRGAEGPSGAEANHADWLIFISSPLERNMDDPTGVCAISYRLAYDYTPGREGDSSEHFSLRRRIVPSYATFDEILGTDDLSEKLDGDSFVEDEEIVATHIIDFHITPVFHKKGETRTYRLPEADSVSVSSRTVEIDGGAKPPAGSELSGVEISIAVLRPSGVAMVEDGVEIEKIDPDHIFFFSKLVRFPIAPGLIR